MSREEYQIIFNNLVRSISELLEVSGNEVLIKPIKKRLYDFSDKLLQGEEKNAKEIYSKTI